MTRGDEFARQLRTITHLPARAGPFFETRSPSPPTLQRALQCRPMSMHFSEGNILETRGPLERPPPQGAPSGGKTWKVWLRPDAPTLEWRVQSVQSSPQGPYRGSTDERLRLRHDVVTQVPTHALLPRFRLVNVASLPNTVNPLSQRALPVRRRASVTPPRESSHRLPSLHPVTPRPFAAFASLCLSSPATPTPTPYRSRSNLRQDTLSTRRRTSSFQPCPTPPLSRIPNSLINMSSSASSSQQGGISDPALITFVLVHTWPRVSTKLTAISQACQQAPGCLHHCWSHQPHRSSPDRSRRKSVWRQEFRAGEHCWPRLVSAPRCH
jgi:hypothetical protein